MPAEEPSRPTSTPAWRIATAGAIRLFLFYVIFPLALSFLARRHGWSAGSPSLPNFLGLALAIGAISLLLWSISLHITRYSSAPPSDSYPPFLLREGPYAFSRNPMYLADVSIWLGWTLFYGSIPVLMLTLCLAGFLALVRIPSEERQLLARFGEEYQLYRSSVPRWLGRVHRPLPDGG